MYIYTYNDLLNARPEKNLTTFLKYEKSICSCTNA